MGDRILDDHTREILRTDEKNPGRPSNYRRAACDSQASYWKAVRETQTFRYDVPACDQLGWIG